MKRYLFLASLALLAVAPLSAQAPKGWLMRVDHSTSATDPDAPGSVKFVANGSGFHTINPQAAVFWNPANTASGNYTLKGTFTANKSESDDEYYGLIFGGSAIEGAQQAYLYFVIAQDGTWLVKRRDGSAATNISAKTPDGAVRKIGPTGKATNALEVRVMANKIEFRVNGMVVDTMPRTGEMAKTDGIYGIRVNHMLEVQVDGLAATKE